MSIPLGTTVPVWRPPAQQGNHTSRFSGAREANLRRMAQDPALAAPMGAAPAAPVLPPAAPAPQRAAAPAPAARPAAAPAPAVATAPPRPTTGSGAADLENAGNLLGSIGFQRPVPGAVSRDALVGAVATPEQQKAIGIEGGQLGTALNSVQPSEVDLETRRRRAFLDGSDSMSGLKAMRGVLADELTARGGGDALAKGGAIPSVKFLEAQIAKQGPAPGLGYDGNRNWTASNDKAGEQATLRAMGAGPAPGLGYDGQGSWTASNDKAGEEATLRAMSASPAGATPGQIAQVGLDASTPALAASGGLPQKAINDYMQTALRGKVSAGAQPLNEVAKWQVTPQPIPALRQDPGRDAALAAFAARGEQAPTSPGEAVLAAGAGNAFGTRGGQFKPGNTLNLGHLDPEQLPPLNSSGYYSGYNPGNFFGAA